MKAVRFTAIAFLSPLFLGGCAGLDELGIHLELPRTVVSDDHHRHGPPPHAPANGYRYKTEQGADLRFDSDLGVYAVVGMPGIYFQNGVYMRLSDDNWQTSPNVTGPWNRDRRGHVPARLKEKRGHGNSLVNRFSSPFKGKSKDKKHKREH